MTPAQTDVERVARAMWDVSDKQSEWVDASDHIAAIYRSRATAALAAMQPAPITPAQAAGVLLDHLPTDPIATIVNKSVRVSHFASALRAIAAACAT